MEHINAPMLERLRAIAENAVLNVESPSDEDEDNPDDLIDHKVVESSQGFLEMNPRNMRKWSIAVPRRPIGKSFNCVRC